MSLGGGVVGDTMIIEDLPNLKIEIENDLDGKMDTDDEVDGKSGRNKTAASSEAEEGELVDDDEDELDILLSRTSKPGKKDAFESVNCPVPTGRSILKYDTKEYSELQSQLNAVRNPNGGFVTGVDIFSPEEQAKLDKRAQRFGIETSESKVMTEKLLKKLYKSMDVKPSDETIRLDALHMRGTEQMLTQDVFNYFKDYGPASLEWITDNSCNVVWLDRISAARALLGLSVHIKGQGGQQESGGNEGRTYQRRGSLSDSDVEMESQNPPADKPSEEPECLSEESDAVEIDSLAMDLPPGRWRRGAPDPLSPCVLLRFATTSDRSQPRPPGYTKYGNHSFGGYVGLISESRKRRLQGLGPNPIFEDVGDEILPKPSSDETDTANPWGLLAKTWSRFDKVRQPRPPSPVIERILPMPRRMTPPPTLPAFLTDRVRLVPRTRMRREREVAAMTVRHVSDPGSGSSDGEEWSVRSKMPRMRMHADDEERKRNKRAKRSHHSTRMFPDSPPRRDVRRRVGRNSAEPPEAEEGSVEEKENGSREEEEEEEVPDLRIAVPPEREGSSGEDTKEGLRERLFNTAGNIKSVLRGARGHSEEDSEKEEEEEEGGEEPDDKDAEEEKRRSRHSERRKQHRKHKESSYHKSRRREESDSDSNGFGGKMRSAIRRKSPETVRPKREPDEGREERRGRHETRSKSPRRRRRKEEEHRRQREERREDRRAERSRRHGGDSRSSKDLRSKIVHSKTYDFDNEFRSKSPLQIEIDNDEYYNKNSDADSE